VVSRIEEDHVAERPTEAIGPNELLLDAFSRVAEEVRAVLDGLDAEQLGYRPDRDANSIAWLVWHLTRVADDHVAKATGCEQVWLAEGWSERFGLPFDPGAHGYGHGSAEVAALSGTDPGLLAGYFNAVVAMIEGQVASIDPAELDRVVDTRFDPPVTMAVRLVSVVSDTLQHAGQAAYVRGLVERRDR
jgi:Protein of unknown function (DUF664)